MKTHIVKTCRPVETEPVSMPWIPRGTYGVCETKPDLDYPLVDFGPPWGVQHVSNADLLDAAAVLENAKRAITLLRRPWRGVMRLALRSWAGPYIVTAIGGVGFYGDFAPEAYLYKHGSKRRVLTLLDKAIELTGQR